MITFALSPEPKAVISAPDPVAVLEAHAERYASVRTKVICDDEAHTGPIDHEELVEQHGSDGAGRSLRRNSHRKPAPGEDAPVARVKTTVAGKIGSQRRMVHLTPLASYWSPNHQNRPCLRGYRSWRSSRNSRRTLCREAGIFAAPCSTSVEKLQSCSVSRQSRRRILFVHSFSPKLADATLRIDFNAAPSRYGRHRSRRPAQRLRHVGQQRRTPSRSKHVGVYLVRPNFSLSVAVPSAWKWAV